MIQSLGIIGSLILAIGGLPQLLKILKDGHAEGLSLIMIWCWVFGLGLLTLYIALTSADIVLLINYGFSFLVAGVILKYKLKPKTN